jgi:hypothetical protein
MNILTIRINSEKSWALITGSIAGFNQGEIIPPDKVLVIRDELFGQADGPQCDFPFTITFMETGKVDATVEFLRGVKIHPDLDLFQLAFIEAKVVELGPEQACLSYSSNAHVSVFARNYLRMRFQDWVNRFGRAFLPSGISPAQEGYTPKADWGKLPPKEKKAKKPAKEKMVKVKKVKSKNARKKWKSTAKLAIAG